MGQSPSQQFDESSPPSRNIMGQSPSQQFDESPPSRLIVAGGSLNGFFFAVRLFELLRFHNVPMALYPEIHMYETENAWRKSTMRIPYSVAMQMPVTLRRMMWPDPDVYARLFERDVVVRFKPKPASDPGASVCAEADGAIPAPGHEADFIYSWKGQGETFPDYPDFTVVTLCEWQKNAREFLETDPDFRGKFRFHRISREAGKQLTYMEPHLKSEKVAGLVVAAGRKASEEFRPMLESTDVTSHHCPNSGPASVAFLIQYDSDGKAHFDERGIGRESLKDSGITFGHSNDSNNTVQVYVYPETWMEQRNVVAKRLFAAGEEFFIGGPDWGMLLGPEVTPLKMLMQIMRMSASDEAAGTSASQLKRLTPTVSALEAEEERDLLLKLHFGPAFEKHLGESADNHQAALCDLVARFQEYVLQPLRSELVNTLITNRKLIGETEAPRARVFVAPRGMYFYKSCGGVMPLGARGRVETAFVGDAMAGTDFALGCSGGRGCMAANYLAEKLVDEIQRGSPLNPSAFRRACEFYQSHWDTEFLDREFRRDVSGEEPGVPLTLSDPDTWFRYVMDGRELSNMRFAGSNRLISRPVLKELTRQMMTPRGS